MSLLPICIQAIHDGLEDYEEEEDDEDMKSSKKTRKRRRRVVDEEDDEPSSSKRRRGVDKNSGDVKLKRQMKKLMNVVIKYTDRY